MASEIDIKGKWYDQHGSEIDPNGAETLDSLWQMSVGLPPGSEEQLWRGSWSGADTFLRERLARVRDRSQSKPSHPVSEYEFSMEDSR